VLRKVPREPEFQLGIHSGDWCRAVLIRAAVLASSVILMLPGAWSHSVTVVEFTQLPAGLAAWQRHSLGIYRVCGPLSKFLYALPAHLAGARVEYPASIDTDVERRREWEVGGIFQMQNREHYHDIYRWSRLFPVLLTVLGGCLVCEWSTRLFGNCPGLISLCLWCWMPPILAHGSLVTSDMLSAVILVLAARSFWAFLLRPNPVTAVLAGLTLGLAQATKFTLLVLAPCWAALLLGRALQVRDTAMLEPWDRRRSPAWPIAFVLVMLMVSVIVIDALYLFHDVGFRVVQWQPGFSSLARVVQRLGERKATAWLLQIPVPIPLEFLRGIDFQLADTEHLGPAYLLGRTRLGGWWFWYAAASLIKLPLPALVLFALSLLRLPGVFRERGPIFWACLCLLAPSAETAVAIAVATGTGTNAAFRYLLPSIALLCVWAGRAWSDRSKILRIGTVGAIAWLLTDAVVGMPDHLGWQNEVGWAWRRWSGDPALIGDSLDWGQDLARLAAWVSRHEQEGSTLVWAYGFGDCKPYGLGPPAARSTIKPGSGEHTKFLAVSEVLLYAYWSGNPIQIGGETCFLTRGQREMILHLEPYDRVGRTIRIYHMSDLPAALFPLCQ
jgi:hypothetical protein